MHRKLVKMTNKRGREEIYSVHVVSGLVFKYRAGRFRPCSERESNHVYALLGEERPGIQPAEI